VRMSGPLDRFARPCECLSQFCQSFWFGRIFRVSLLLLCLVANKTWGKDKEFFFFFFGELVRMRKKKRLWR
jgi:hypothetical protein